MDLMDYSQKTIEDWAGCSECLALEALCVFLWSLLASLRASCDSLGMQVAFPDFFRRQATPQLLPIICKEWGPEGNLPLQILTLGMLLGCEVYDQDKCVAAAIPGLQSLPKIYLEHFWEFLHENLRMEAVLLYFGCKTAAETILGYHGGLF